ncbi:MAG: acyltransferase family protein [Thermodesulfobacteriota bacterium]
MKKIDVINGLRGFAILWVIFFHLFYSNVPAGRFPVSLGGVDLFPIAFLGHGWVGVNLFFILSGFVLYLPYAEGRRKLASAADAAAFYGHRAARLLPLYYLSILLSMFFFFDILHRDAQALRNLLLMVTATFNFTRDMWFPKYNGVLWSIGIEIWFSLLFPVLLLLGRRLGLVRLFVVVAAIGLATRFLGVIYWEHFPIDSLHFNPIKDSVLGRMDDFVLGMLAAGLYVKRLRPRPLAYPAPLFFAGVVLVALGCNLWDYHHLERLHWAAVPFLSNLFHAGFALIMVSLLSMEGGAVRFVFTNRPVQVIGMMCYSLYVWHQMTIYAVIRDNEYTAFNLTAYFAVLFAIAGITYRYVEFGRKDLRALFLLGPGGGGAPGAGAG